MANPVPSLPPSPSPRPPPAPEDGGKSSGGLWYVGAIINVVGSVSINLGMNLMKLGHTKRAQMDVPEEQKPPIRKFKIWVIGIVIFITGNILNFVSFAFAAQSLLAALGSLQLVCNVFFAYIVNKEAVTWLIILSTCCIIGGCVLLVVFGNQSSETYTVDQLIDFYTLPAYVVYLVMMAVFVFGFYVLYLHSKKVCRKRGERGLWYGIMLVSYAIFSALLGSQSVLFGKSISVILRTTFTESNQLGNWYTWVVLPIFTFTALFWVTRLNKGLRMFPAMIIVPLLQIAWTLFSIVSGMLYFQEYKGFTMLKAIMFPVGVAIVFIGVFILTSGGRASREEEEGEGEGEEAEERVSGQRPTKMNMYDNAVYSARNEGDIHPGDTPHGLHTQSKISLGQTLRFMSTWAPPSVAVSPSSNLNRTLQPSDPWRRQRRLAGGASDLNATYVTDDPTPPASVTTSPDNHHPDGGWGNRTFDQNSTLNRTAQSTASRLSETSMVSTMRKGLRSVGSALTSDMGVNMAGFKLAVGLGDSDLAGVSLFTMPALDFTATAKQRKTERKDERYSRAAARNAEMSILNALPRSRFYKGDPDGLTVIAEASGAALTTTTPSPELGASLTNSSQLPASSLYSQNAAAASAVGTAAARRVGSNSSNRSPEAGRSTPPQQQHSQVSAQAPGPRGLPDQPLTEAAMSSFLPVPSFQPARPNSGLADVSRHPQRQQQVTTSEAPRGTSPTTISPRQPHAAPITPLPVPGTAGPGGSAPGVVAEHGRRSRRPSVIPEAGLSVNGHRTPPGLGSGLSGLGGVTLSGVAMVHTGNDSDNAYMSAGASIGSRAVDGISGGGGGTSALYEGPGAGPAQRVAPASLSKPRSLGAILPEGVPLSTANSVVIHESGSWTPPELTPGIGFGAGIGAGAGQQQETVERWPAGYSLPGGGMHVQTSSRSASPWQQSRTAMQQQMPSTQQASVHLPQAFFQQQFQQPLPPQELQQPLIQPQQIPLSMLHRVSATPSGSARLPALRLMIPGLSVSPSQLQPPGAASTAGTSYTQYGSVSMSYAQMLAAQGFVDSGLLSAQPLGAGSLSLGSVASLTGVAPAVVQVQGRSPSPHSRLSVSRSWAGLARMSNGGAVGAAGARQSPLRGTLVAQMQRPLRPWQ